MSDITVVVNGRFHAFDYASELHKRGKLNMLISTMPYSIAKKYDIPREKYIGFPIFEVIKLVVRKLLKKELPTILYAKLFTLTSCYFIPKKTSIIISFAGYSKEIYKNKRFSHCIKVLDRGSTHTLANMKLRKQAALYHNINYNAHHKDFISRELMEYELADYILVPSSFVKNTFIEENIPSSKIITIPYAYSKKKFRNTDDTVNRESKILLFVGQLCARKGIGVLINAMRIVIKHNPDVKLWLVGPMHQNIQMIIKNYDWLSYFGILKGDELKHKYQSASLFVLPSFEEGLALVLTEAMNFKLPIIATPNTGIEELVDIDEKSYFLIDPGNHEQLAEKINFFFDQDVDTTNLQNTKMNSWEDYTNALTRKIEY